MVKGTNVYKIIGKKTGESLYIANKHTERKELLHYNEEDDTSRALRYATNVKSVFEDEQGGGVIKTSPIIFEYGILQVPTRNPTLIKFLSLHPDNAANGGTIFELVDHAAQNKAKELEEEMQFEAMALSREISKSEQKAITRVILPSRVDKMTEKEMSDWIKGFAKSNPESFLSLVESSEASRTNVISEALAKGIIEFKRDDSEVFWNHGTRNTRIFRIAAGKNPRTELEKFLMSNKGKSDFEDIEVALQD